LIESEEISQIGWAQFVEGFVDEENNLDKCSLE